MHQRHRKVLDLLDSSGQRLHAALARVTLCEHTTGDLMQELFLRLSNSKGLDGADEPFAYAWRVAMNLAFQWRRKRRLNCEPFDEERVSAGDDESSLDGMVQAEQLEQVLDATSQLTDLARDVVVMRYIEQESYDEIAQRLGKKPQHVRSVCAKALARLRELLRENQGSLRPKGAKL